MIGIILELQKAQQKFDIKYKMEIEFLCALELLRFLSNFQGFIAPKKSSLQTSRSSIDSFAAYLRNNSLCLRKGNSFEHHERFLNNL